MNTTIELLTSHRSIRKFTEQSVPQEWVEQCVQAGQAAATSSFIQACTVIQVEAGAQRERLAELSGAQAYIVEAPVFLVFCADMRRHQLACEKHQSPMNAGYTEQFLTASLDCALFAQNTVVAAESLGLGVCYIGALRNQIAAVTELLALPELVYPVFGLCVGFPDQNPEVKPRLPLSAVLKHNVYSDDDAASIDAYDQHIQQYYQTRTGNPKSQTWTEQISGMLQREARPHMAAYLKLQGFNQK